MKDIVPQFIIILNLLLHERIQENAIYLIGTFNSFVQRQGTVQVSIER